MRYAAALAVLAAILALPFVADNYVLRLATITLMYTVLALSWNFIGGMAGYPSFATAAFFGLGAYAGGVLQGWGVPMPLAWLSAGLAAALFAGAIGGAILHLRGHYFAIASLIVAEVLREIVNTSADVTGGGMGLNLPILRIPVAAQAQFFYAVMLLLAAVTLGVAVYVRRGRLGFGLTCIQQNEDAAGILGVDAARLKTVAFMLSAVFVGWAGAIYASWVSYIEPPDVFDIMLSLKPVVMVLLGGLGTIAGPIFGAIAFVALEELVWRNLLTVHAAALGVLIVVLVLFMPEGLLAVDFKRLLRSGRLAKRAA